MKRRRKSDESINANITGSVTGQVGVGTNISQTQQVGAQGEGAPPPKPEKWWQTFPAKIAAVIGTFATLIGALHQAGWLPVRAESEKSPPPNVSVPVPDPRDIARETKLIGVWHSKAPLPNGAIWDCTTTYSADNQFVSSGMLSNAAGQSSLLTLAGKWKIVGDQLRQTNEHAAGESGQAIIGREYSYKIIRLTDDSFTFFDETFTHREVTVTRTE